MKKLFFPLLLILLMTSGAWATQSTIVEADGTACMGDDKSRKQTEAEALANAKRKAAEYASSYIKSETSIKDLKLEKDLIDAYSRATVTIIQKIDGSWYRDAAAGDCYRTKIKAEVIPDEKAMQQLSDHKNVIDDPSAPLNIQAWTDKKMYKPSERIKIYIKGNKPFYARVLYKDVKGNLMQLLPNPYRKDNYFNGGVIYEIPSGNDSFELEVTPPFGPEDVIVYAGVSQLGDINLSEAGGVYQVKTSANDVGLKTRGIQFKGKGTGKDPSATEFFEKKLVIQTGK